MTENTQAAVSGFHPHVRRLGSVREITDMDGIAAFRSDVKRLSGGPKLALTRISTTHVDRALPPRDGVFLKNRFRFGRWILIRVKLQSQLAIRAFDVRITGVSAHAEQPVIIACHA